MSADNWAKCPKCDKEFPGIEGSRNNPLREDYEFYLVGFVLHVYYHCKCDDCDFQFELKREIDTRNQEVKENHAERDS